MLCLASGSSVAKDSLVRAVKVGALPEELLVFNDRKTLGDDVVFAENEYLYPNFFLKLVSRGIGIAESMEYEYRNKKYI